jgi:phytanoyl-CoA hydroxylase
MLRPTLLDEMYVFNEADYYSFHPGIAEAVEAGVFKDGWAHYLRHGRSESRRICRFDERFYVDFYPLVAGELAAGRAANAFEHYVLLGRGRGYLPHATAPRRDSDLGNGGLWIDAPDALDRVYGRYETGQITEAQATQLESFVRDGCVLLEGGVSDALIEPALADFERAWRNEIPGLRFECRGLGRGLSAWQPVVMEEAAKVLDIHYFSNAIRALIFAPAITGFLGLIFENKAFASQTQAFLRGAGENIHQDSAFVSYTHAASFASSWIALEDVTAGAGELYYHEGSHRFPGFQYGGKFKSVHEALRASPNEPIGREIENHTKSLNENVMRFGLEKKPLLAKRGDVFIAHADLVYGGEPISPLNTRKSIMTHYCPKHLAPLFCEVHKVGFHEYEGHTYSSSHYAGLEPSD